MAESNQLGIYWGTDAFYVVETSKDRILTMTRTGFDLPANQEQSKDIPEGLKLSGIIQNLLREKGITAQKTNLSIPSKELIFRSFVIPWMQSHEIKNVVSFEVTKYMPIKLEELVYTYHAVSFSENNQKRIRILFVAIRRDVLERYTGILEHSGLGVGSVEPAFASLVRSLKKHRLLLPKVPTAVVGLESGHGQIMVYDDDVVQFVREFPVAKDLQSEPAQVQIFKDLGVAFNYYHRQNPQSRIDKILLISPLPLDTITAKMPEEFGKPVTSVMVSKLFEATQDCTIGHVIAHGISMSDREVTTKDFNLSEKAALLQTQKEESLTEQKLYKTCGAVIAACAVLIFLTVNLSSRMVEGIKNRKETLINKQSVFQSLKIEDIHQLSDKIRKRLTAYQDIKTTSDVSTLLLQIPQLMPDGTWLRQLTVDYVSQREGEGETARTMIKPVLQIEGYAYLPKTNEQFRLVNNFVSRLKSDTTTQGLFASTDLETVRQENFKNYFVTYFKLNCK